jgi:hypothetical protein
MRGSDNRGDQDERYAIGSLFVLVLATAALAAGARCYVVVDTVGNCYVVTRMKGLLRVAGNRTL